VTPTRLAENVSEEHTASNFTVHGQVM
jgi:hypothetical protein